MTKIDKSNKLRWKSYVHKEKCEECGQRKVSTMLRPNGKRLCSSCNQDRVRKMTPTGLVDNEKRRARGLYDYYVNECDMAPGDARERLAIICAREPATFNRLVPLFDELKGER